MPDEPRGPAGPGLAAAIGTASPARHLLIRRPMPGGELAFFAYQVRRYDAWYRHATLSMLALAFLAVTREEGGPAPVDREQRRGRGCVTAARPPVTTARSGSPRPRSAGSSPP
jgi:hypothetical protein